MTKLSMLRALVVLSMALIRSGYRTELRLNSEQDAGRLRREDEG